MELTVETECLLWGSRVVIPPQHREQVLQELHVSHPGMCRMKALARTYVWWLGLDQDIEKLVKACSSCVQVKAVSRVAPLHSMGMA